MESNLYRIKYVYHNADWVDKFMFEHYFYCEFMEAYNRYSSMANSGITEKLNEEFKDQNPRFFENHQDRDWTELIEYNRFMADGYNKYICNILNKQNSYGKLEYFVNPNEVAFSARFKLHPEATVDFVLIPA